MILVDTSVWVDHLRASDKTLANILDAGKVLTHPFVVGEIALGRLPRRDAVLSALSGLPQIAPAADREVLRFIGQHALFGVGIGYIDAHLLASVRLLPGASLWTRDRRLHSAADRLGLASPLPPGQVP